jgi:lipopolysaccharide transport system permease protein
VSSLADRIPARGGTLAGNYRLGSARYLRSHWRLLWRVTKHDLRQRYAGSFLGLGWAMLAPLLLLAIYGVVYIEVFRIRVPDLSTSEYVFYVFSGLVPYLVCADAISQGVTSVITNKAVLNNTVFPIDLTPVKPVLGAQVTMATGLAVVLVGAAATMELHTTLVLLPVIWLLNVLWLMGVNWILSVLNVMFRDLQNVITVLLMATLVASPIAYTPEMVPATLKPLLYLNPMAYFVIAYQQTIMLGVWPSLLRALVLVVMSIATFAFGAWFFARVKRVIVDYV